MAGHVTVPGGGRCTDELLVFFRRLETHVIAMDFNRAGKDDINYRHNERAANKPRIFVTEPIEMCRQWCENSDAFCTDSVTNYSFYELCILRIAPTGILHDAVLRTDAFPVSSWPCV